ncbi:MULTISPECIES: hypothetical protein [unclassified Chelatococcus]|uniref:hypothetical protein n=1 Tax=unclassified Chelatococcus TaxID=2638111 RepID=UPI001BCE6FA4|nr:MULTISPECIES: hypothetical protein [unclassified Chelatococcus]CAH1672496.1 conserved hypothetical protein [Hyphomicrobiales bacterium]MBS7738944.1 hypothetical protein [Chelatococcus sp. HY11]MBX3543377.1 hypothetical protein [Chelatococcus sp.]MCO5076527.1 hypothetical protein [Chelatococcus sp.]CAH1675268.1 conserved hypothetical protein [Hyphomicrobiales bacterium]
MVNLPITDRLQINAILDRMLGEADVFALEDGRQLARLVPFTSRSSIILNATTTETGSGITGHAPGIGNVTDDRKEEKTVTWGDRRLRVGGYKLTHKAGEILIGRMWDHTEEDPREALFRYNPLSGEPIALDISYQASIGLGPLKVGFTRFTLWKKPSAD